MGSFLLLVLAVTSSYFPQVPSTLPQTESVVNDMLFGGETAPYPGPIQINEQSLNDIKLMLKHEAPHLNPLVIYKSTYNLKMCGSIQC